MPIQKVLLPQFMQLSKLHPLLDVRSPGEFAHAHMPNAFSLPLFTDEERKVVGTAYKQQSREKAIKIGLDYFGVKMRSIVEEVEKLVSNFKLLTVGDNHHQARANQHCILVHCWRGGMRSAGVAWLLDLYGFKVYTLSGGYKVYREWVRMQFDKPYQIKVIGGYTGTGKTLVLQHLKQLGYTTIDLEKLASHKGSAFGSLGEPAQPKQEMFENLLAEQLNQISANEINNSKNIFIEDESQRIGSINLPTSFWEQMRNSSIYFLEVSFEDRLSYLTEEYGKFDTHKMSDAIIRLQKRLGGLETKNAVEYLHQNNHLECFRILLKYYDKWYEKGLNNRENLSSKLKRIVCANGNAETNSQKLIDEELANQ